MNKLVLNKRFSIVEMTILLIIAVVGVAGILNAVTVPTTIQTNWDEGSTNFGDAVNYYIVENDERYNVVWRGGIHVTSVFNDCVGSVGTKTYTISTEPDLAGPNGVELWTRAAKGKPRMVPFDPSDPSVVAHLELSVEVTSCP